MWVYFGVFWTNLGSYAILQLMQMFCFPDKIHCFVSLPLTALPPSQWIRVKSSLYLLIWHASSGSNPYLSLLGEMSSQKIISSKEALAGILKQTYFLPTAKPHPLNPLTEGPPPMYWLGISRWCPGPYACATTICVCLLSLPHHSCHSYVVLFCYAYWVVFVSYSVRGVWAFGLTLHSFVPSWTGYYLGKDICLYSPLGFHFCHSSSCPSHGPCGFQSCHTNLLGLLSLYLGFLGSFTLSLPLTLLTGLLAIIPIMLAHWACYLFLQATLAHLLHLYLLFLP